MAGPSTKRAVRDKDDEDDEEEEEEEGESESDNENKKAPNHRVNQITKVTKEPARAGTSMKTRRAVSDEEESKTRPTRKKSARKSAKNFLKSEFIGQKQ
ncbi:hypothetical protein LSTR_LSTR016925 [Laodelphax striatellus]|uniref:Uncharacterized protein n=1 Tax=Laodelphax striatellus TaxID=195883 RepID=A0A482XP30_LAOST|nr:hypothetical protein LSTR_LSTR016925 [Laodelphax striatellus]